VKNRFHELKKEIIARLVIDPKAINAQPYIDKATILVDAFIYAVRQEERDRINTLLLKYEVIDLTSSYYENTWIVKQREEDLPHRSTLYSTPIDALLSRETK
jgi:hypothetical protein